MTAIRKFVVVGSNGHLKLDMPVKSYAAGARDLLYFAAPPQRFAFLPGSEIMRLGFQRTSESIRDAMKAFRERKSA